MQYVRVSEILSRLRDRSKIHPLILDEKARLGTEVHANIAAQKGDGFPVFADWPHRNAITGQILYRDGEPFWSKKGLGYFRSFCDWDEAFNPVYSAMEQRYYDDELMITGQIDALIRLPDQDKPMLLDFKCSAQPDLEIWSMQAHFYWYLLRQNGFEDLEDHFLFLQLMPLSKDGNVQKAKIHQIQFDDKVLARCMHEAQLYWEEKNNAKDVD